MGQELITIARIKTGFSEKFGIPRQSGLVNTTVGEIIFEPAYRSEDALKGLEEFSHIWLLWGFSKAKKKGFSATVTPPRLGGKERKGVFATRSPFRPNSIGLSSVMIKSIRFDEKIGPVIEVMGADLLDGTPIYDIKPYISYTDSHPDALCSYASVHKDDVLDVVFPEEEKNKLPLDIQTTVEGLLAQDPRAAYNKQADYVYGMNYQAYDIRFTVDNNILTVVEVVDVNDVDWSKVK